jgi:hypothetical protein
LSDAAHTIAAIFRIELPKLVARLARVVRDVGRAEELAQDAMVIALERWPAEGVPDNPGAWLMTTAKRRAIDQLRRAKLAERTHEELGHDSEPQTMRDPDDDVPPPRAHLVRYFGVFAPNARVRPRVVPASPDPPSRARAASCPLVPEPVLTRPARRPILWAELLKRTFQTDVLTCPRCGGTRRVVAVVLRAATAQAILEHLRLPSRPLPLAPATSPPQLGFC